MSLPRPLPGLVLRYRYLWADDAAKGEVDGDKARPAAIVMVMPSADAARVYVLPITHSPPAKDSVALEIPAAVRRAAGLDAARAWVVLSELNEFLWPGFDLDVISGRTPRTVAYGFLTPGFFVKLRDRWLEVGLARGSRRVVRDE